MQVKTKNLIVGVLVALLFLLLFYRVVYGSMQSQASKAKKNQQNYETQINSLQQQLKLASPGGSNAPTKGVTKDELAAAVPPAADEAEFFRIFDQIRDASGVAFQQISPTNPQASSTAATATATPAASGVQSINVGITIQGTYAEVQDYVDRLMHAPRLLVIDSENVTVNGSSSGGSQTGGAAVGPVFAGQGSAPMLQVQLAARMFTIAAPAATTGNSSTTPTTASH